METLYVPRTTNHVLHLILTGITCGLWLPVWGCVWAFNSVTKRRIVSYRYGEHR